MSDANIEIEYSPLCGKMERDGIQIEIFIYRIDGSNEDWSLEIVDEEGTSIVWDDLFDTDQAALDELCRAIEEEGILAIIRPTDDELH
jgi:hypothetical protein